MITGLPLHRAGTALPANRQFWRLTAHNSKVRTPSTQSTKASPSPHPSMSYSFLPFLFIGVLASIPTNCWNQKQEGTGVSNSALQLCASWRHAHPYYTSEDSKTWDQFQFGLLVLGRREGREAFWLSDPTLTICKSLSRHWSVCRGWWSRISLKLHPLPHCMQQLG